MISINFNPAGLISQRSINQSNIFINQAVQRLSSGLRVNKASDDPAAFFSASRLKSQMRSLAVTSQNVASGINFLETASNSLSSMNNILNRLNDLALQASDDSLDSESRSNAQKETNELLSELFRLRDDSKFNGINVFGTDKKLAETLSVSTVSTYSTPPPKLVCRS